MCKDNRNVKKLDKADPLSGAISAIRKLIVQNLTTRLIEISAKRKKEREREI